MENAEEILQCLDEFSKLKPKDIPRELEDYMCFVAKTGDPVYQWSQIKCLFREKLISVITEFYEACPSVDIPPCPNVDSFNYDATKSFILEKLDTFAAAPFTVQRICELLTCPRKEYNRIDKYMRALEKNILVVSTREPGNRKSTENGESVVNGLESEHVSAEINVEVEMADETAAWPKNIDTPMSVAYGVTDTSSIVMETTPTLAAAAVAVVTTDSSVQDQPPPSTTEAETLATCSSSIETVITSRPIGYIGELIIEPATTDTSTSEPAAQPAVAAAEQQPTEESQTAAAVAMATEQSPAGKEEPTTFVAAAEQPEQPYASVIQLEPEPSAVQVDQPPEKPSEAVSSDEPEPSDAGSEAQPSAETSSSAASPEHAAAVDSSGEIVEPQPSSAVQDAEEPSSATAEALEPSVTPSSSEETVISSTDEAGSSNSTPAAAESCPGSSDSMPAASESQNDAPAASESCPGSSESTPAAADSCNQVSESNQAECVVSQTDTSVVDASPSPGVETTSATVAESTEEESMDVDEPSVPLEVTEVSTNQQTDTTEATAAAVSNN